MPDVVVFENAGEIDPLMIRTFGVSVKETENPVGFFGTGLKYAVAVLLRTGHEVSIQSGETILEFGLRPAKMRGQEFNLVTMAGEPLGYTDQVGKTWKTWMAYRELYCNAKDEGGEVFVADESPAPEAGKTRVVVRGEGLTADHLARSKFIVVGEPWLRLDGVDVYDGESRGVFYRGILVHTLPDKQVSRFTYNMTRRVDLTEDRTAAHPYFLPMQVAAAVLGAEDDQFLSDVLACKNHYMEHQLDYKSAWGDPAPGAAFVAAVERLARDRAARTNVSAVSRYKEVKRAALEPATTRLRGVEAAILERAVAFCKKIGFDPDEYPLVLTDTLGAGVLGMAEGGRIYVARQALMQGTKRVAGTIVEEVCHLRYGYADETREFQDFLVDRLVSMGEELQGAPL